MYPAQLFAMLPPFPKGNKVFVVMSFDDRLGYRWCNVIELGIQEAGLEPFRVDARVVGDSILTEILKGISESRLVFVDITALDGCRNENVMYELGLAHAVRQPQEVLVFRSDNDRLLFDITQVRVNTYHPEKETKEAKFKVSEAVKEAVHEIDLTKAISVQQIVDSLTCWEIDRLCAAVQGGTLPYPSRATLGSMMVHIQQSAAIARLLRQGLLRNTGFQMKNIASTKMPLEQLCGLEITDFGKVVVEKMIKEGVKGLTRQEICEIFGVVGQGPQPPSL